MIKYTWERAMPCDITEVEPHTGIIGKLSVICKHQLMTEIFKLV